MKAIIEWMSESMSERTDKSTLNEVNSFENQFGIDRPINV